MEAQDLISIESNDRIEQFNPGDTVKVSIKVREGDRERTQVFQGVVIPVSYTHLTLPTILLV